MLHLKKTDIEELEVTRDPFVEGEVKEEKEGILDVSINLKWQKYLISRCKIRIRKIGQREVYFIIVGCLQRD